MTVDPIREFVRFKEIANREERIKGGDRFELRNFEFLT